MKRKSRGKGGDQIQTPKKEEVCADESPSSAKVGRPSLGDVPMTPETLKKRKKAIRNMTKQSEKTSKVRSEATKKQWAMRILLDKEPSDNESSVESAVESSERETEVGAELLSDDEATDRFCHRTHCRHKLKLQQLLSQNPLQNFDQTHQELSLM